MEGERERERRWKEGGRKERRKGERRQEGVFSLCIDQEGHMSPSALAADLSFQRWSGIFRKTQYLLPPISIPACFPPLWPAGLWEALAVWGGWARHYSPTSALVLEVREIDHFL